MAPPVASLLCALAIIGLLVRDVRKNTGVSYTIWIPICWFLIIGSRLPSEWLVGQGTTLANPDAYLDGSPLDRNVFLALIVLGAAVLLRRSISWGQFFTSNIAIVVFFAYTLVSIVWSDYPLVAFKRWHKVVGHLIMAMVVLTDPQPTKAFGALFRRCAFVLLPLSVLFIKYYPELGRGFDVWTGAAVNPGVTTNKNALGNLCLISIPMFLAAWFSSAGKGVRGTRLDRWVNGVFLVAAGWLLIMADSSAALVSTLLAIGIVCCLQLRFVRRRFTLLFLAGLTAGALLLAFTDLKDQVILALGEDTTLTGRTDLWLDLEKIEVNPLVGVGFESFWVGDRVAPLWEKYWWHPNQAHNGYYEMYLNLGYLGLLLQAVMIVSSYRKARKAMLADIPTGEQQDEGLVRRDQAYFRLAFLVGLLAFNLTDATFKALHPSFFTFFVVALAYPQTARVEVPAPRTVPAGRGRAGALRTAVAPRVSSYLSTCGSVPTA